MKKKGIKLIISFAALAAVAAVIAAYFLIPDEIRKITGIEDGQELYIGETTEPDYDIKPAKFSDRKSQLKFTMSDSEVASVDENGSIKANKLGETVLTISVMDFTEDITLKVVAKVKDIKGVKKTISMTEGHSVKLTPEIVPAEDRFRDIILCKGSQNSICDKERDRQRPEARKDSHHHELRRIQGESDCQSKRIHTGA